MRAADRLTQVLRTVAVRSPTGLTLAELSALCALDRATALRLARSLCESGWLRRSAQDGRYLLGVEAWLAGRRAAPEIDRLVELARPRLRALSRRTGDTVYMAVRSGLEVVCVLRFLGMEPIAAVMSLGQRHSLAVGATGIALLAATEPQARAAIMASLSMQIGSGASGRSLRAEIEAAAQRGFAISRGSYFYGVPAIGAVVRGEDRQPLCALSLAARAERLTDEYVARTAPRLLRVVASVERALRAEGPPA